MAEPEAVGGPSRASPKSVTISEFRARLAEMVKLVEHGEEVVITRGQNPVARLAPLRERHPRKLGTLRDLIGEKALAALSEAVEEPLSSEDRAVLEGAGTDALGMARAPGMARR